MEMAKSVSSELGLLEPHYISLSKEAYFKIAWESKFSWFFSDTPDRISVLFHNVIDKENEISFYKNKE